MLAGRCMFLLLVMLVLLAHPTFESEVDEAASRGQQLQKVIKSAVSGLSKLGKMVKDYQGRLDDTQTRAVLADCLDLAADSKDVVKESLSILLKLNSSSSNSSSSNGGSGGTGTDTSSEDGELIRTNLSAAMTDITTCTDGLQDELSEKSQQAKVAVGRIINEAGKVSLLLSRALRLVTE